MQELQPTVFILENVVKAKTLRGGLFWQVMITYLSGVGYTLDDYIIIAFYAGTLAGKVSLIHHSSHRSWHQPIWRQCLTRENQQITGVELRIERKANGVLQAKMWKGRRKG